MASPARRIKHAIAQRAYPEPLRTMARAAGFHLVRADYYSPIPDLSALSPSLWTVPAEMPGVDLCFEASLKFLQTTLAPYIAEYSPPDHPPGTRHGYFRRNGMYPLVDGEILYAMVRHHKPRQLVELGAGFSSQVVSDAVARNEDEGNRVARTVYDPYPAEQLAAAGITTEPVRAQEVPLGTFQALGAGDMLIIDTTHTVKAGGDVVQLILNVLPRLAGGVVVHIHDFFRPFEYPRWLFAEHALYWQEHYLVQAFLALNTCFEVLLANYALTRRHPREVAAIIPGADGFPGDAPGSALWIRRRS